jgi:hypothetical protein
MDRVRIMQQNIEKHIKKRMQDGSQESAKPQSKGLLAPRNMSAKSRDTGNMMSSQDRNLDTVADYILDIRKQKEEILNAKAITD